MANFYLDISALGNEYQAYADTPATWAVPQDGNGKAGPGHAAAVAVATIDVAGCTASGTGTIGVFGVTVSSTLNATGSALATAIASAINASGTAVSATYSAALLPLNRLVYARVNPGLNTQVQIMLRIAGTDWVGFSPTQANISPAATISNFAGGADGPFAYFINNATVFGKTAANYGIRVQKSAGVTDPSAAADYIWTRTKRSTSNLTAPTFSLSTTTYLQAQANRYFIFDAGNTWTGDNGVFTFPVAFTAAVACALDSTTSNGIIICEAEAAGGFVVTATSTVAGAAFYINARNTTGAKIRYANCVFEELNTNVTIQTYGTDSSTTRCRDCWFKLKSSHAFFTSAFSIMAFVFEGGGIEFSGLSADVPTLWSLNSSQSGIHYRLKNFTVRDTGGLWKVTTPMSGLSNIPSTGYMNAEFENVSGFRAPSFGFNAYGGARPMLSGYYQSADGDRPFRFENQLFTTDFIDDGTFPTAGALLPSGNEWAIRCTWLTSISRDVDCTPFTRHFYNRASTGVKTLTLEMLCSDTVTPKTGDLYMTVSYKDNTGVRRVEQTACVLREDVLGTDAALAAGSATWDYNGLTGFSPKKLTLTTAYQVAINTSITVSLTLCGTPASNTSIYIHPDVGVA